MKINKIILRICHFFGFRRNEAHFDDIKFYIPTEYEAELKRTFGDTYMFKFSESMISDIKEQTYRKLKNDNKLRKWCSIVKRIWVVFPNQRAQMMHYVDGVLYWPVLDDVLRKRCEKLNEIL